MRLTKDTVLRLTLPEGKTEALFADDRVPGLALRLREGGSRTWTFQYRIGRRQRRLTIGAAAALSVADAQAAAAKLHARVRLGEDPAAAKEQAIAAQGETFGAAASVYLDRQARRLRPRSLIEVRRHLLMHAKPLHKTPLAKISRRDVAGLVSTIAQSSGPTAANRTGSSIAAYLAWAVREGWLEVNVAATINRLHEEPRSRVLTDDEYRRIWAATSGSDQYSAIVRLLMLGGWRRQEIGGLRWSEIDFDLALITLPAERVKTAQPHQIPLSAAMIAILKAQSRREGRDDVFGEAQGGFRGWSQGKVALDKRAQISPRWVIHDLRRSFSTHLNELGVQPHVVEHLLNHVNGRSAISRTYNRATYAAEKRQALALWAEHLAAIVEERPAKIVTLRA